MGCAGGPGDDRPMGVTDEQKQRNRRLTAWRRSEKVLARASADHTLGERLTALAAEALVIEMGGEPEWIEEANRPLYHAALALGANHLVTLVAQSMELLSKAGVAAPDRMLGPLLGAALDNALRSGDAALTGPVARGDAGTVAAHVAELRKHAPGTVAGYLAMARTTADRALAHGLLKPELAEDLLGVLAEDDQR